MLFSILMCTYNSAETLSNAIESLRSQTYKDWQLIAIDNGSTDNTVQLLKSYSKNDARILCRYNDNNIGWCKGISEGLKMASGEYMMFLGADDIVFYDTFHDIADEINKHNKPDIIWTGNGYANYINGQYNLISHRLPSYKNYNAAGLEQRLKQMVYIMNNVYYNSVMHYVNIDFLKRNGIDFYEPYYGDCQGMTEAMCRADNMVVLDKEEYLLVLNTSQTSQAVIYNYNLVAQWQSIRNTFAAIINKEEYKQDFKYIAKRISNNMVAMLKAIVSGSRLRDLYMNSIEVGYVDRFLKVEEWLSNRDFIEMLDYSRRIEYVSEILYTTAASMKTNILGDKVLKDELHRDSKWLFDLLMCLFDFKKEIEMKKVIDQYDYDKIECIVNCDDNVNRIGMEYIKTDYSLIK